MFPAMLASRHGREAALVFCKFVETDWVSERDTRSTLDSSTGIEWLDLNETKGLSINAVMARLSGDLKGWRLPTATEVDQMLSNFYALPFPTSYAFNSAINPKALEFSAMFGETLSAPAGVLLLGLAFRRKFR